LLNQLANDAQASAEQAGPYQEALRSCARKLSPQNRRLLAMRYASSLSTRAIAQQIGSSVAAVSQSLHRIRAVLLKCIREALSSDGRRAAEVHPRGA
jgi:RNA polymerase sigma factor (sigma-70 family)